MSNQKFPSTFVDDFLKWSTILIDKGVVKISAYYTGSGGSGDIDEIYFLKQDESLDNSLLEYITFNDCDKKFPYISAELFTTIKNSILSNILLAEGVEDWTYDEGGYGWVHINLLTSKYRIDNNVYVIKTVEYTNRASIIDSQI